jgi:hypothetical protein
MIILKETAPIVRATPISKPSIRAVRIIASILIAGPEYKNAIAGPRPAPLLCMLENSGRIVHEHTARIVPETDATVYATHFFAWAPKYFVLMPDQKNRYPCNKKCRGDIKSHVLGIPFYKVEVAAMAVLKRAFTGRKMQMRKLQQSSIFLILF